jgi:branched-chain amino acid transport system substrate-binding protein
MIRPLRRQVAVVLASTMVAALVAACSSAGSSSAGGGTSNGGATAPGVTATSIVIGSSAPLTGDASSDGTPVNNGAAAWFSYVNSQGGVNGRKIDLQAKDDALVTQQAVANAQSFASEPVFAIYGGTGSASAVAISQIAQSNGIPYMFPNGGPAEIVQPTKKYLFAFTPLYADEDAGLVQYAFKKYGPGSLAILDTTLPDLNSDVATTAEQVKLSGGTYLGQQTSGTFTSDWTPYVLKLKKLNPDYVLLEEGSVDAVRAIDAMVAQGWLPAKRILGITTLAEDPFLAVSPKAAGLVTSVAPNAMPGSAAASSCETAFKEASPPVQSTSLSLLGCSSAQVATLALKKAGSDLTRAGFLTALQSLQGSLVSSTPPLSLSATNHTALTQMFLITINHGRFVMGPVISTSGP